jgi:cytochrome c
MLDSAWHRCRCLLDVAPAIFVALCLMCACHDASAGESRIAIAGGDAERGKAAIVTFGCGSCHTIPGIRTAKGMVGPPLLFWSKRTFIAGEVPNTPDYLIRWIEVPQAIEPGTAMPNLGVPEGDARDIAAYLYTLR